MKKKPSFKCSICGQPIEVQLSGWAGGHNAEPVNDGRCCSVCNDKIVIPMRMARLVWAAKQ